MSIIPEKMFYILPETPCISDISGGLSYGFYKTKSVFLAYYEAPVKLIQISIYKVSL